MAEYATAKKSNNYASSSSTSYGALAESKGSSQLNVIYNQVKENTQGVCTCEKKVACRGTCRA
jgi:hypothetical protein